MSRRMKLLLSITLFNAVTAVFGGIGLIGGTIKPPLEWLDTTPFASYVLPGLILSVIVGGSALLASWAIARHASYAHDVAGVSGYIMMGWILGEIALIRQLHWLQALYLISGYAVASLAWSTYAVWKFSNISEHSRAKEHSNHGRRG